MSWVEYRCHQLDFIRHLKFTGTIIFTGSPYYYFAYGVALSEVIVDTLTGEILRVTFCMMQAIHCPALDKGQVEAVCPGVGWLTTEELMYDDRGALMTHAPSTTNTRLLRST